MGGLQAIMTFCHAESAICTHTNNRSMVSMECHVTALCSWENSRALGEGPHPYPYNPVRFFLPTTSESNVMSSTQILCPQKRVSGSVGKRCEISYPDAFPLTEAHLCICRDDYDK